MGDQDDESVWLLAKQGAPSACRLIYERHAPRLLRFALARVSNFMDAEDVVAATFLVAWKKSESVAFVDGSMYPWLAAVARHHCLNQARSARRQVRLISHLPHVGVEPDLCDDVLDRLDAEYRCRDLSDTLQRLSDRDRRIADLRWIQGAPVDFVADELGVTAIVVRSVEFRLRVRLRREMTKVLETDR